MSVNFACAPRPWGRLDGMTTASPRDGALAEVAELLAAAAPELTALLDQLDVGDPDAEPGLAALAARIQLALGLGIDPSDQTLSTRVCRADLDDPNRQPGPGVASEVLLLLHTPLSIRWDMEGTVGYLRLSRRFDGLVAALRATAAAWGRGEIVAGPQYPPHGNSG